MSSAVERLVLKLSAAKVDGPYGKVTYADPKNKRFPIDTKAHVRAALSYIQHANVKAKYPRNGVTWSEVNAAIQRAAKKFGIA